MNSAVIKNNFLNHIKDKKQSNFIIFHDAYNYLFNEFNINHDKILILSETAGREPSVAEMKEIIDSITKNNIKILFREPQLDTKLIQTLSSEYSLKVLELDPLGKSIDKNDYFNTIEMNLNNLSNTYE
jgi:zinc transport system substrate-binding protein